MPSKVVSKNLMLYRKKLSRVNFPIACHHCKDPIHAKDYEAHSTSHHGVNSKTQCVWCLNYSWPSGKKNEHGNHLLLCSKKFITRLKEPTPVPEPLHLMILKHTYPERDYFGIRHDLPERAQETPWPLEYVKPPMTFADENLNLAASYVFQYLQTKDTHDWFHVMVKSVALESFLRAIDQDRGVTRMLLFSCWCNGGKWKRAKHRQHRHLIVVSPRHHFTENVWKHVKLLRDERPYKNFPCKRRKTLVSAMHLANTLGYLSNRKSRCEFSFKEVKGARKKDHHFYLHKTLPSEFLLPLVLLWDGGVYQKLYQEQLQHVSIPRIAEQPMTLEDGQWKQKLKHFYGYTYGKVLPVTPGFAPTDHETSHYLHLMNGRKLHFEYSEENEALDPESWLRKQVEGGNSFYGIVGDEMWTPRPHDQQILHYYKPVVNRNTELETENKGLKRKYEELEEEYKNEVKRLNEKIHNLNEGVIGKLNTRIQQLEDENTHLKNEVTNLKDENTHLKIEVTNLKNEVTNLKNENCNLKTFIVASGLGKIIQ